MASEEAPTKSVTFSEEMDNEDGTQSKLGGSGESAQAHSLADTNGVNEVTDVIKDLKTNDDEVVDDAAFDPSKMKKKKKKSTKEATEEDKAGEDTGFDATALKKKKKKKAAPANDSSFDQKLADAGVVPVDGEDATAAAPPAPAVAQTAEEQAEELANGTGIWAQSSNAKLPYSSLLKRFFILLHDQHPDLAGDGRSKSYKIPPPQVLREGNKKSIFANLPEICRKMKRQPEHVIQFLFAELGTSGSVDGNGRLVIKGRFQQKQLENVIRHYIVEYLTCRTCKSPDTVLNKENRLYFITCNSCGSRRSVTTIKTGFQATVGKRKRMQT